MNMNGGGCRKKSNDFVGGTINLLERLGNGETGIIQKKLCFAHNYLVLKVLAIKFNLFALLIIQIMAIQ